MRYDSSKASGRRAEPSSAPMASPASRLVRQRRAIGKNAALGGLFALLGFALSVATLGLLAGCSLLGGSASHQIGEVHLFGLPTALTIPGSTLPGGLGIRIYASEPGGTLGRPIQQGRLDVLMFDQPAAGLDPQKQKPIKVWSFEAADLASLRSDTMLGICYQLELRWNQERPKGNLVTVFARYHRSDKLQVYSKPTVIALTTH